MLPDAPTAMPIEKPPVSARMLLESSADTVTEPVVAVTPREPELLLMYA